MPFSVSPYVFKQPWATSCKEDSVSGNNAKDESNTINNNTSHTNQPLKLLETWKTNYTTRRSLRKLDDTLLRDIGLDRSTALREAKKPFWKK